MRGDEFVPKRGKILKYNTTVYVPPIGFRDPSKFGLLELKKESLDELVSRLEIEAKEAIKRRIDSVYFEHAPYDTGLPNISEVIKQYLFDVEKWKKQWKKFMTEQHMQFAKSYVDVVVIESDGCRYEQRFTKDVWDFIKMSAEMEYKNGQNYYKINNKIYTNE